MKQTSFAEVEFAKKKRVTRREKFLGEMDRIVPWARWTALIEPLYPTSGRVGRQPIGVERTLRLYCLQQWLAEYGMRCSMSRNGNCWDAPTEGFFSSLKNGRVHAKRFRTHQDATADRLTTSSVL
ncbi:hypothetical protein LMG26411_06389 [Cupriavidus numazuensis]|uniref:Transposase InsH N-terminal domain-containing protein n=1 Tax=Cupriavidus numazuensis TaxID=221992 RepID=A0ABM8TRY9_9BURK|nr:hypothetical protein LMG26411_06389 [Cupriavidus numazuensis]